MSLQESAVFLAQGASLKAARQRHFSYLAMCYGLTGEGDVRQFSLLPDARGTLLGICDRGYRAGPLPVHNRFVTSLLWEVKKHGYNGVFADFEQHTAPQAHLLRQLEESLGKENLPLYAPHSYAAQLEQAVLVLPCQVSGGSVRELLEEQIARVGAQRLALDLTPACHEFSLPAQPPQGIPLSAAQRQERLSRYGSSVFYSREMLCKYFTFMDESQQGHYVLFDDISTLEAKMHLGEQLGIQRGFLAFEAYLALEREAEER